MLRRILTTALLGSILAACGSEGLDDYEDIADSGESGMLSANCSVNLEGVLRDVETDYLPNVVHCENGGAPFESLKAQAIAARTYLYYKLETSGAILDGEGHQVYTCDTRATELDKRAVAETAGMVLQYKGVTICSFFVAGGLASGPSCQGGDAPTEHYVTYNSGRSGSSLQQSSLGWINEGNVRNRGCLSQYGSRCLADAGNDYAEILRFYYGDDISLVHANGACTEPGAQPRNLPTAPGTLADDPLMMESSPDWEDGDDVDLSISTSQGERAERALARRHLPEAAGCSAAPGTAPSGSAWLGLSLAVAALSSRRSLTRAARRPR